MEYDLKTNEDDDYLHVKITPKGTTKLGDLAGRMEKNGLSPDTTISGYEAEAELSEENDALYITLDLTTGDSSPTAMFGVAEDIRGYLEDDINQDILDEDVLNRFRGGRNHSESYLPK